PGTPQVRPCRLAARHPSLAAPRTGLFANSTSGGLRTFLAALLLCSPPFAGEAAEDLLRAAQRNDATVALAAIEDGVDVNGRAPDGTTALHWAAYNGNAALVERLVAAGADVTAANQFGATPLSEAAVVGNAKII